MCLLHLYSLILMRLIFLLSLPKNVSNNVFHLQLSLVSTSYEGFPGSSSNSALKVTHQSFSTPAHQSIFASPVPDAYPGIAHLPASCPVPSLSPSAAPTQPSQAYSVLEAWPGTAIAPGPIVPPLNSNAPQLQLPLTLLVPVKPSGTVLWNFPIFRLSSMCIELSPDVALLSCTRSPCFLALCQLRLWISIIMML